jgi:hypothetical protein
MPMPRPIIINDVESLESYESLELFEFVVLELEQAA